MTTKLRQFQDEVSGLKLDDSLMFLNHLLSVSRGLSEDAALQREIDALKYSPPAFIVHFLAKQLLLHASNLGQHVLDWSEFHRLMLACIEFDNPILNDPNWKNADPTGYFEQVFSQQLPAQYRNKLQNLGLALGLFNESSISWPEPYTDRRI